MNCATSFRDAVEHTIEISENAFVVGRVLRPLIKGYTTDSMLKDETKIFEVEVISRKERKPIIPVMLPCEKSDKLIGSLVFLSGRIECSIVNRNLIYYLNPIHSIEQVDEKDLKVKRQIQTINYVTAYNRVFLKGAVVRIISSVIRNETYVTRALIQCDNSTLLVYLYSKEENAYEVGMNLAVTGSIVRFSSNPARRIEVSSFNVEMKGSKYA